MQRTYIITIDEGGTYIETPDKVVHIIGHQVITTYDNGNREVAEFCRNSSAKIQGFHAAGLYS